MPLAHRRRLPDAAPPESAPAVPALSLSLLVIAPAQLMLVLDDAIANIALPSIQRNRGVSATTLPWIVSAYVLAFGSLLLFGGGLMATYFLLTQFMQEVLEFSPIRTGLASLPVALGIVLSAGISSKLVERVPPRAVSAPGPLIAAGGLFWLSTLEPGASYAGPCCPRSS
jgi:predicted MFS family arabinose efflux permease